MPRRDAAGRESAAAFSLMARVQCQGGILSAPRVVIQDFRPDEIILAYWREVLDIGENDEVLPVEFMEGL